MSRKGKEEIDTPTVPTPSPPASSSSHSEDDEVWKLLSHVGQDLGMSEEAIKKVFVAMQTCGLTTLNMVCAVPLEELRRGVLTGLSSSAGRPVRQLDTGETALLRSFGGRARDYVRSRREREAYALPDTNVGGDEETAAALAFVAALERHLAAMGDGLVERDHDLRLMVLAAMAGEHVLLLGDPGVGKSELARRLLGLLSSQDDRTKLFSCLLSPHTEPAEVFGPHSLSGLRRDRYERETLGYLPTAQVAFLDEFFKASTAVLNSLLMIINERLFRNGVSIHRVPLRCLIAASNKEYASAGSDELAALYDRFLIRKWVGNVSGWAAHIDLLSATTLRRVPRPNPPPAPSQTAGSGALTRQIGDVLAEASQFVNFSPAAEAALYVFTKQLKRSFGITIMPRRYTKIVHALQIVALASRPPTLDDLRTTLNASSSSSSSSDDTLVLATISLADLAVVPHMVWLVHSDFPAVKTALWDTMSSILQMAAGEADKLAAHAPQNVFASADEKTKMAELAQEAQDRLAASPRPLLFAPTDPHQVFVKGCDIGWCVYPSWTRSIQTPLISSLPSSVSVKVVTLPSPASQEGDNRSLTLTAYRGDDECRMLWTDISVNFPTGQGDGSISCTIEPQNPGSYSIEQCFDLATNGDAHAHIVHALFAPLPPPSSSTHTHHNDGQDDDDDAEEEDIDLAAVASITSISKGAVEPDAQDTYVITVRLSDVSKEVVDALEDAELDVLFRPRVSTTPVAATDINPADNSVVLGPLALPATQNIVFVLSGSNFALVHAEIIP